MPTLARKSTIPISRSIRLALMVVYVTRCILCPKRPIRMATTSGPPARPNFTGVGMPGNAMGRLPNRIPRKIPTKMVTMFGVSRRFNWLPSTPATRSTASCWPTTITRSPTWSTRLGSANRSIPERLIRVTLTPYILRKCMLPSFFPLISDLVTRIRRETIGVSCFSQST